ncbi:MAG TPA: VCBS repeat-containing protein [Parapedobacter sp.]|uniref:FG-GAP repeat domain-containing protein n=1 Tax=Parapedobacter sp. TaxID=1958893 RepID=UPI002C891920|nr:VCBS repeat-containing protein [Parapedobacter sp.]HWK56487.1 VCBS repeat-containing protein [Parapedobacter sp.]
MMMNHIGYFFLAIGFTATGANACTGGAQEKGDGVTVAFEKHTLTTDFISEGVAVADVNNDGHTDIIAGAQWFEGPDWKNIHHIYPEEQVFDGTTGYSNSMLNFTIDVDQDGWVDYIRVDFPGKEVWWYQNPGTQGGFWKQHVITATASNESPAFVDVDGDGREDILCGDPTTGEMVWFRCPTEKGDTAWTRYTISGKEMPGTDIFSHGLGFGDINGDGRGDVVIKQGCWEAPADPKQPDWVFHPAELGQDCAQMYVIDVNGDGYADVISSSAHQFGIWWHEQGRDAHGDTTWKTHEISSEYSQTHALSLVDMNGDGHLDLVTGMRYFAHMGKDPGEQRDPTIFWLEFVPGEQPTWVMHIIDEDSGVGLNNVVEDLNGDGLRDIVVANKKGVFYFERLAR